MNANGYYNLTQDKIDLYCEPIYESLGAEQFNRCQQAAASSDDEALVAKYANKLTSGYTKSFDTYVRNEGLKETGSSVLVSTLHNLFNTNPATTSPTANQYQSQLLADEEKKKAKRKLYIGLGIGAAVITAGIVIYMKTKK